MAVASLAEGVAKKNAAVGEANQMRLRANTVQAQSQHAAIEERRQADLVHSRARVVAASSGGSTSDATVVGILGDIDAEGEYRAMSQLWNGDEEALGLRYGADIKEREGQAALEAGMLGAASTVAGGSMSMKQEAGGAWKSSKMKANVYNKYGKKYWGLSGQTAADGRKYWGATPGG
jgi:hypothetical protein